jgi:tetratricopeptide (TPR) repeat protein
MEVINMVSTGMVIQRATVTEAIEYELFKKGSTNEDADSHNDIGVNYHICGKIDEAIGEYTEALRINPFHAEAHNNLGAAYYARGEIENAIREFETAREMNPSLAAIHYNMGVAYRDQNKLSFAILELEEAIRLEPDDSSGHFTLGEIYQSQGKVAIAIECYMMFIKLASAAEDEYIRLAKERIIELDKMDSVKIYSVCS